MIFGGQDITKDVEAVFGSSQAIAPPSATPAPSEIGFVDQTVLDGVPKVQTANNSMNQFETTQRQIFSAKLAAAKNNSDKQQILQRVQQDGHRQAGPAAQAARRPDASATADVARKKNLLLVFDKADVIYGGTDITTDVQNALTK